MAPSKKQKDVKAGKRVNAQRKASKQISRAENAPPPPPADNLLCPSGLIYDPTGTSKFWKDQDLKGVQAYPVGPNGKRIIFKEEGSLVRNFDTGHYVETNKFAPSGPKMPYKYLNPIYEDDPTHPQATFFRSLGFPELEKLMYYTPPGIMTPARHEMRQEHEKRYPPPPPGPCNSLEGWHCGKWFVESLPATNDIRDMSFLNNVCLHKMQTLQKFALCVVSKVRREHQVMLHGFTGAHAKVPQERRGLRYDVPVSPLDASCY